MNTIRLLGYSIRVSNDINVPQPESSCYIDPGNVTLPTIVEEDCEGTARYVWIYQSKKSGQSFEVPMLEICEVQVFGTYYVVLIQKGIVQHSYLSIKRLKEKE